MKHTQWEWNGDRTILYADDEIVLKMVDEWFCELPTKKEAKRIVHCCNNFDELVYTLEKIISNTQSDCNDRNCGKCSYCIARRLIKEAEEV